MNNHQKKAAEIHLGIWRKIPVKATNEKNGKRIIAACDCTGHGVPGALMSIVNYNLLNRAVLEHGLTNAGAIKINSGVSSIQ